MQAKDLGKELIQKAEEKLKETLEDAKNLVGLTERDFEILAQHKEKN